jgi:mannosidase alpha-like ER degradation enhancer 2
LNCWARVLLLVFACAPGAIACAGAPRPAGSQPSGTPPSTSLDRPALAAAVRTELLHAWRGYERHAWGHDELRPLSRGVRDWYGESLLMTPVDSLDTLLLAGLDGEAAKAKELIVERLSFDRDASVQVFEVTIRLLGGLLSGYQMTGDERLLALANDLGKRLLPAFDSPTGMPYRYVNLRTGAKNDPHSNPAEIGTILLELGTLAKLTGEPVFWNKPKRALGELYRRRSAIGLVGEEIDVETGEWRNKASHVGGAIDSYYEYLLKCEILFGDPDCGRMWRESKAALDKYSADEAPSGLWYGQVDMDTGARTASEFGALHAFLPGVLALGGDVERARRLQDSAYSMWRLHRLEPEVIDYRTMKVLYPGYKLRPEIVESAYVLFKKTGDPRYLEMGRTFLADLVAHCRTEDGYTVVDDVTAMKQGDLMPSYFLAETLKYLYLLFAPDETIDLSRTVFNTEAHPLRRTW